MFWRKEEKEIHVHELLKPTLLPNFNIRMFRRILVTKANIFFSQTKLIIYA